MSRFAELDRLLSALDGLIDEHVGVDSDHARGMVSGLLEARRMVCRLPMGGEIVALHAALSDAVASEVMIAAERDHLRARLERIEAEIGVDYMVVHPDLVDRGADVVRASTMRCLIDDRVEPAGVFLVRLGERAVAS